MAEKHDEGIPPIVWFLGLVLIFVLGGVFARIIPEDTATTTPSIAGNVQQAPVNQQTAVPDARLVGAWRSTDDAKYTRTFNADGSVTDGYVGDASATQTGTWMIVDPSKENVGVAADSLGGIEVIKVTFSDGSVLYYGVSLVTSTDLSLIYFGRGNTLSFTKVQ